MHTIDLSSLDAGYIEDVKAGNFGSNLSEPKASFQGVDHDVDLGRLPQGVIDLLSSGTRFHPGQPFPVLFEPNHVVALLQRLQASDGSSEPAIAAICAFIRTVIESGDCLSVARIEV